MTYPKSHMHVRPVAYFMAEFSRERREERARAANAARVAALPPPVRYSVLSRPKRRDYDPIVRNLSKPLRTRVWVAQGRRCYLCLREIALDCATRDHVTPKMRGGRLKKNQLIACGPCNVRKGSREPRPCERLYLSYINLVVVHRASPVQREGRQTAPEPVEAHRVQE